jgi:hypothetical protein
MPLLAVLWIFPSWLMGGDVSLGCSPERGGRDQLMLGNRFRFNGVGFTLGKWVNPGTHLGVQACSTFTGVSQLDFATRITCPTQAHLAHLAAGWGVAEQPEFREIWANQEIQAVSIAKASRLLGFIDLDRR